LFYAGRYATTRAKLRQYLDRKVAGRGWGGAGAAPVETRVERLAGLGYVDDKAFAAARASSLARRGFGERRLGQALHAAGIAPEDAEDARQEARDGAWAAALRFAERKRLGPYAQEPADRDARHRAAGAMLRAGHPPNLVRRIVNALPGEIPDSDGS
jgi:regulatory protein